MTSLFKYCTPRFASRALSLAVNINHKPFINEIKRHSLRTMSSKKSLTTPAGFSMPNVGFGTWQAVDSELEAALEAALEAGYRLIDTATVYNNEHIIGNVLKKWFDAGKLKREDIFITTKLPSHGNRASEVEQHLNESLKKLQVSYVDLYLIHMPFGFTRTGDKPTDMTVDMSTDHLAVWKEMEKQVEQGKTKAIGVSNFNNRQVERILKNCKIAPANNQVEMHVYFQQPELVEFHKKNNVTITSYATLGSMGTKKLSAQFKIDLEFPNLMENPAVVEIAQRHKKTGAQVLLRHMIQQGIAIIPKSTTPERIKQNIDIFDFELNSDDMEKLKKLDLNQKILRMDIFMPSVVDHPEYPWAK